MQCVVRKGRQSRQILSQFVCGGEDSDRVVVAGEQGRVEGECCRGEETEYVSKLM